MQTESVGNYKLGGRECHSAHSTGSGTVSPEFLSLICGVVYTWPEWHSVTASGMAVHYHTVHGRPVVLDLSLSALCARCFSTAVTK